MTSCFKLPLPWLLHSSTGKQTLSSLGSKKEKKRRKEEKKEKENLVQNFPLPIRLKERTTEAGGHKNICMAVWCACAGCLTETRLRMLCPFSPHYWTPQFLKENNIARGTFFKGTIFSLTKLLKEAKSSVLKSFCFLVLLSPVVWDRDLEEQVVLEYMAKL